MNCRPEYHEYNKKHYKCDKCGMHLDPQRLYVEEDYNEYMGKLKYIIQQRIEQYKHDIDAVLAVGNLLESDRMRIREDEVIIQELEKILSGKNLDVLSFK